MFVVPLTSDPNQSFRCTIPVNGQNKAFDFVLRYNDIAEYWVMAVSDAIDGRMYVSDVPLVAGIYPSANLLEQFEHLRIGAAVLVKTNPDNQDDAPNGFNLGTDFELVWSDNL